MCSRYNLIAAPETVRAVFGLEAIEFFPPRYNIAPTQPVGIVRRSHAGPPEFHLVRWGLIPGWIKDPSKLSTLINARAETVADRPAFRGALRHRRCLVPATGFYAWSGTRKGRVAHLYRPKAGGVLALAGLAEHWLGADGSELETMAILTAPTKKTPAPLHERMPLIIPPSCFAEWLDCRGGDANPILPLLADPPGDLLECAELNDPLNGTENDGPELLRVVNDRLL